MMVSSAGTGVAAELTVVLVFLLFFKKNFP
jgi:hypothetical protein